MNTDFALSVMPRQSAPAEELDLVVLDMEAVAAELYTALAHIESLTPNHPDP
ncbi:hypothetical protein [Streptomyces sp. NPDC018055]|uniref:hypothetical protein n=1 Tax=Streptomyces sp. NPDC018055 TaxID=3365038 RepID=UPI0037970EE4